MKHFHGPPHDASTASMGCLQGHRGLPCPGETELVCLLATGLDGQSLPELCIQSSHWTPLCLTLPMCPQAGTNTQECTLLSCHSKSRGWFAGFNEQEAMVPSFGNPELGASPASGVPLPVISCGLEQAWSPADTGVTAVLGDPRLCVHRTGDEAQGLTLARMWPAGKPELTLLLSVGPPHHLCHHLSDQDPRLDFLMNFSTEVPTRGAHS